MKMAVFWEMHHVVWQKFTDVSEMFAVSIIRVIKKASTTEMLVNF
jgi:hypothetical protein